MLSRPIRRGAVRLMCCVRKERRVGGEGEGAPRGGGYGRARFCARLCGSGCAFVGAEWGVMWWRVGRVSVGLVGGWWWVVVVVCLLVWCVQSLLPVAGGGVGGVWCEWLSGG